ncbi:glycosyltransferase 87 family protein [Nocardioides KLBMP 9356]|uniref:Glycosyltransferase 87 family protein n=1 Tax=Nocardioides potassii TaxID=2911371 RepID=A0ABS9H7K2_9ACTN|nr:glycosyltransferase 87 family protein [Nocardioides potassii]MCF6376288.1 glycosyltransferase 87 family protein [Nocardioides potassii]
MLLIVVAGLVAARHLVSDWRLAASGNLGPDGDISVYIGAINFLNSGGALYDYPLEGGYGFTYPPFASIVLQPLTWADPRTTGLSWMTACIAIGIVVVALVVASRPWPTSVVGRFVVLGLAVGLFFGSVEVQSDLITGQVNLVLALLVVLDVGRFVPDRFRGVLVGLAAAIKLTPMIVWGWFFVTRQWRALAISVGTFVGCGLLAWVVLPSDSRRFWTEAVFDTGRVGDVELRFNSSVMGVLARAGLDGATRSVLWLLLGGVLVLAAYWNARRARRAGDHVAAAIILGCAAVIATPIAWPHHQIWLPLAGIVLATRTRWLPQVLGLVVLGFAYLHIVITRWSDAHGTGWFFDNIDFAMFAAVCVLGLAPGRPTSTPTSDRTPLMVDQ